MAYPFSAEAYSPVSVAIGSVPCTVSVGASGTGSGTVVSDFVG